MARTDSYALLFFCWNSVGGNRGNQMQLLGCQFRFLSSLVYWMMGVLFLCHVSLMNGQ